MSIVVAGLPTPGRACGKSPSSDNYIAVDEMTGGKVTGGPGGSNTVNEMTGGTFAGGAGADNVTNYTGGTVW